MWLWAWVWKAHGITHLMQLGGSVGGKGRKDQLIPEAGSSRLPRVSVPSRQKLVGVGRSRECGYVLGYGR